MNSRYPELSERIQGVRRTRVEINVKGEKTGTEFANTVAAKALQFLANNPELYITTRARIGGQAVERQDVINKLHRKTRKTAQVLDREELLNKLEKKTRNRRQGFTFVEM